MFRFYDWAKNDNVDNILTMIQSRENIAQRFGKNSNIYKYQEEKIAKQSYLMEQATQGNETAKNELELKSRQIIIEHKQPLLDLLDNNTTEMLKFIKSCSTDSFCNSSDIYDIYKDKAKETKEGLTK
jgi:hypothetical protein